MARRGAPRSPRSSTRANLRILERQGWIELAVAADRRQRFSTQTRRGRAVFGKALIGWQNAQADVAGVLQEDLPRPTASWFA